MQVCSTVETKTPDGNPSVLDIEAHDLLMQAKKADEAGYNVSALLHVCQLAIEFAEEQQGSTYLRGHLSSLSRVLQLTDSLVVEMHCVVEKVVKREGAKQ